MAEHTPIIGNKRRHSTTTSDNEPVKRRRVYHQLRLLQRQPSPTEPAPQDPKFAQSQLLRSITAALAIAGFDSVKPTALEMFRSHAEEYILKMLHYVRTSMQSARRTHPVAQDFTMALSLMPNTGTASLLRPQLELALPDSIACPAIAEPDSPAISAPDFSTLLQPLMEQQPPAYIPAHFPKLPPHHAWKETPVFPDRERDPRKMREKATEEGMMAEQALRKLASAAKAGALKAERHRSSVLSGPGKARVAGKGKHRDDDDTFADVMKDVGGMNGDATVDEVMVADEAGVRADGVDVGMADGVVVNCEMGHWRRGAGRRAL